MKRFLFVFALSMAINVTLSFAQDNNVDGGKDAPKQSKINYVAGQVLVKFKTENTIISLDNNCGKSRSVQRIGSELDNLIEEIGITEVKPIMPLTSRKVQKSKQYITQGKDLPQKDLNQLYVLKFDSAHSVEDVIMQLKTLDNVEYAEPNYIVKACADYTSEPRYGEQWGLQAINMPKLWQMPVVNTNRPIIAILDSGTETTHPDLAANIWRNEDEMEDGTDSDTNGFVDDIHGWNFVGNNANVEDDFGHGTHCAGIAAAVGNNSEGICGANPDALIMPVKVLDREGLGSIELLIQGIDYAVANGADIISMSMSTTESSQSLEDALSVAYSSAILLASAGNESVCMNNHNDHNYQHGHSNNFYGPYYPAASKYVMGVMATNESGELASFSNFDCDGPLRTLSPYYYDTNCEENQSYELKAPGENILSTYIGGGYVRMSGTSMACPMAAGAISRLLQCRDYSHEELLKALVHTSGNNIDMLAAYQVTTNDLAQTIFTIEHKGVTMTFVKTGEGTCELGDGEHPAIDVNTQGAVFIPEEVHGLSVAYIAAIAFKDCSQVTEVEIPFNVSGFGWGAFQGCTSLTRLMLKGWTQNTFEPFDETTYTNCVLQVLDWHGEYYKDTAPWKFFAHHEYYPYELGRRFYAEVDSVKFPFVVTSLSPKTVEFGWDWQEGSDSPRLTVESADIPSEIQGYTVTSISENAFAGNQNLVSVVLPPTIKHFGRAAFAQCPKLESINIPEGVTALSECMFDMCTALTSIDLPSSIKYISGQAFDQSGIASFTFPPKVTSIEHHSFCLCPNLKHLSIPSQIKRIEYDAFDSSGLETIVIGSGVEYIGAYALSGCTSLRQIVVKATTPPEVYESSFSDYSVPLKVPKGCKELYQSATIWKRFSNISEIDYTLDITDGNAEVKGTITEVDLETIKDEISNVSNIDMTYATLEGITASDIANIQSGNMLVFVPTNSGIMGNNIVNNGVCSNLVITEGQAFAAPSAFTATAATYSRNVTSRFGTMCLPYSVSSDVSTKYYTLDYVEGSTLYLKEETEIAAGIPAVLENIGGGSTVDAIGANVAVQGTAVMPTSGNLKLIGTYEKLIITDPAELAKSYYISKDQFHQATNSLTVNPFRAYFTYTGNNSSKVFNIATEDDDFTVVNSLINEDAEIEAIYDVSGVKLTALQKGLNIVKLNNGKTQKIVVR